jgi:hypothetical protein
MSNRGNFIENEARYQAAIQRNIQNNARKTRARVWLATDAGKTANAFLFELDQFESTHLDEHGYREGLHPVVKACLGPFYFKMRESVLQWGGLTEGQTQAVLDMIQKGHARVAERAKARAESLQADADKSGWIGDIGQRIDFDLTVRLVVTLEGIYGLSFLHVMHDNAGNVIVYKGTNRLGEKGDNVKIKATIKGHDMRDNVRQTKIARPKILEGIA